MSRGNYVDTVALSSFYEFVTDRDSTLTNLLRGLSRPRVLAGDPSPSSDVRDDGDRSVRRFL